MSNSKLPIKVLYIAGEGRSGSTVIGNILGELKGFFFIGEAISVWHHFAIDNKMCSCGVPAWDCPVWGKIIRETCSSINVYKMQERAEHITRNQFVWKAMLSSKLARPLSDVEEYLHNVEDIYRAVASNSAAKIIVDSSKKPLYAFFLNLIPYIQVYTLHLVRDSRGVAHSWKRKKIQQHYADKTIYMHQFSLAKSAWRWNISNFLTELLLRRSSCNFLTLRYEDFIDAPQDALRKILDMLNLSEEDLPELPIDGHNKISLSTSHSIWGNPNRFITGPITLQQDDEWQHSFSKLSIAVMTILTIFGLYRYRYL